MGCVEIDMGKSRIRFVILEGLSRAHYDKNSTDRDEMIKACNAYHQKENNQV